MSPKTVDSFFSFIFSFMFLFFIGLLGGGYLKDLEKQKTLISKNLAHYDMKTSKFIEDSLVFHGDTIIVIRKDK